MTALQPCGTQAAYKRHRRRGEDPCQACREANAEAQRRRRIRQAEHEAARLAEEVAQLPVVAEVETAFEDRLADAEENLRVVIQVMNSGAALPQTAALSRRRQELQDYIAELKAESEKPAEVSIFDELANRRRNRERGAAAQG